VVHGKSQKSAFFKNRFAWSQIYETLVRLDTELNEVPGLATSWEPGEGGKVWTFKLRQGIKFHDGTPFTAATVLYSYGERADVVKSKVMPLVSVEALDDYTVRFVLSRPAGRQPGHQNLPQAVHLY